MSDIKQIKQGDRVKTPTGTIGVYQGETSDGFANIRLSTGQPCKIWKLDKLEKV